MSQAPRSVIRSGPLGIALALLWVTFVLLLALAGFFAAASLDLYPAVRLAFAAAAAVVALYLRWEIRATFPGEGRLRVAVGDDTIEFTMPGKPADVLRRADIELIVIDEGFLGTDAFEAYGPEETVLGYWTANWPLKPPQLPMRVLKRHGYPYALRNMRYRDRLFYRRPGRPVGESR